MLGKKARMGPAWESETGGMLTHRNSGKSTLLATLMSMMQIALKMHFVLKMHIVLSPQNLHHHRIFVMAYTKMLTFQYQKAQYASQAQIVSAYAICA